MSVCSTKLNSTRVLCAGFIALAVANIGQWYLQRHSGFTETVTDFSSGLLQGIAIATLLLGIWLRSRDLRAGPPRE